MSVSQYTGVTPRRLRNGSEEQDTRSESLVGYKIAAPSDLVVNTMLAWNGSLGVTATGGIVSPAYAVYRFNSGSIPLYFHFLFRTQLYKGRFKVASTGVVESRLRLYPEDLLRVETVVPPPEEQHSISEFVASLHRRIDKLMRAKRRVIEVVNEQKHAIIHRAVTRGLEGNVPLVSSGSECWGNMPKHWRLTKLYRITQRNRPIMYGIVLPGPHVDEGVFIVKGGNCEPGKLHPNFLSRTTFDIESKYVRSRLRANDIVYSIRGSIGAAELVPQELTGANLTQDAARIAPGEDIDPRWLLYAVRSRAFFARLDAGAVGATIRGINIRDLKRADLVIPPLKEQQSIAAYLDRELASANEVVARTRNEIELMMEYRTRLIADVVTGKLDVRGVELPEFDELEEVSDAVDEELEDPEELVAVEESVDAD